MAKKKIKKEKPVKGFEPKEEKKKPVKKKKIELKKYEPSELANKKSGDVILLNGLDLKNVYIAYPIEGEGMSAVNLKQMDYAINLSELVEELKN